MTKTEAQFDTVIIGGGIIGCSCAYQLALKGQKVAVVEKSRLGGGTSARNFSWANGTSKTSDAAYHHLNARGLALYHALGRRYGMARLGLNSCGALALAQKTDGADFAAKQLQLGQLEGFDYPCRWLTQGELARMEPNIKLGKETEALFTPSDIVVNTGKFIGFLADRITALEGVIRENCAALEIVADDDGKVKGVQTAQGVLQCASVLIATGPDTPEVMSALTGYDGFSHFPVGKVPGLLLTTPPLGACLIRHLIYSDIGMEFHMLPDFQSGLRVASDDIDGQIALDQTAQNLEQQGQELLHRLARLLPATADIELVDCALSVGVRAYPEDGKTIAGVLPGSDGVYIVATHSGVTLAPVIGVLMADLIVNREVPDMLRPFTLERLDGF